MPLHAMPSATQSLLRMEADDSTSDCTSDDPAEFVDVYTESEGGWWDPSPVADIDAKSTYHGRHVLPIGNLCAFMAARGFELFNSE